VQLDNMSCSARRKVVGDSVGAQTEQAMHNLIAVLAEAGATAITAQFVRALGRPDCLVEIDAIAAVPA
jgi:enamine deaminase RidA (YjgF/YER057c/UK114 family)